MSAQDYRLDDLNGLRRLLEVRETSVGAAVPPFGSLFCPRCGDYRWMDDRLLWEAPGAQELRETWKALNSAAAGSLSQPAPRPMGKPPERPAVPSLFHYTCRQCRMSFTALVYQGPAGPDLIVLPSQPGGLKTEHTPLGVAFYLDQAQRAESAGARSAAVAMYRSALEHLLLEQGYRKGMLSKKLEKLESDIQEGPAPQWARDLDTSFLAVLKDLGNAAIHPNDGDVSRQATFDQELLAKIKETFLRMLFLVYEAPKERDANLDILRTRAAALRK